MKKFLALALAVIMVLALSVPALAAAADVATVTDYNTTITVDGIKQGNTLTLYRIAAMKLDPATNEVTYDLASTLPEAYDTIDELAAVASNGLNYVNPSAAMTLANQLAYDVANGTLTPLATVPFVAGTGNTATGTLPAGWYVAVVTGTEDTGIIYRNMLVNALPVANTTTGNYDAHAAISYTVKSENITVEKTVTNDGSQSDTTDDYKVGDRVPYTITTEIPNYPKPAQYATFKITDTPTNLTDDITTDFVVNVNGAPVAAAADTWTVARDATGDGFVITFVKDYILDHPGQSVVVNYKAVIKSTAIETDGQVAENTAKIIFNPNPNDDGKVEPGDTTEVYNYGIYIKKIKDGSTTPLANAEFDIKNSGGTIIGHLKTDAQGYAAIENLAQGTYTIVETKAPAGYRLDSTPYPVTVGPGTNGDNPITAATESYFAEIEIPNTEGSTLPETGGIGTTIFYVVGALLVVGAGVLLITKTRMSKEQ